MIQDIAPKKLFNQYRNRKPADDDYLFFFHQNQILIRQTGDYIGIPQYLQLLQSVRLPLDKTADSQYLFCIDEDAYFLYPDALPEELVFGSGIGAETAYQWMKLSDFRYLADQELCFAVYTAYHLYQWYRNNRFCGCCGARTVPDQKERMLYCESCGSQIYPRISPAVIAAVTDGDRILLTKYANREYKRYALIAGFTEIGETAEETVCREVMEEAGLQVKNIRYYKSQPWGIDGNLLFGYFAQLDGSAQICMDEHELSTAEWVSWEKLKDMDDSFSLTREMMRVFYEECKKNYSSNFSKNVVR